MKYVTLIFAMLLLAGCNDEEVKKPDSAGWGAKQTNRIISMKEEQRIRKEERERIEYENFVRYDIPAQQTARGQASRAVDWEEHRTAQRMCLDKGMSYKESKYVGEVDEENDWRGVCVKRDGSFAVVRFKSKSEKFPADN